MAEPLSRRMVPRGNDHYHLLRLLAALGVIVSHSFAISGAPPEPLEQRFGLSCGGIAVDVFFVISGFLVTSSLLLRRDLRSFVIARALRLFPVLIVGAFGCAFVLGPWQTDLPLGAYLTHPGTWMFAIQNSVPWPFGVVYTLPGVFQHVPLAGPVNGSLWSLPWELTMYAMLTALGAAAYAFRWLNERRLRQILVGIGGGALLAFTIYDGFRFPYQFHVAQGLRLTSLFFGGAILWVKRERVPYSAPLALLAALLLVGNLMLPRPLMALYVAPLAYLVIVLAYAPAGPLAFYRRAGDYSYGTYVYAFPVGQCVAATLPDAGTAVVFALTVPLTLALAIPSWHLIERPLLDRKPRRMG